MFHKVIFELSAFCNMIKIRKCKKEKDKIPKY